MSAPDQVKPIQVGLIGFGKIAQDQHVPVLQASDDFELAGIVSLQNRFDGVPNCADLGALAQEVSGLSAVAICTPPQARFAIARDALQMGLDVLLEKPPGISVSEVQALAEIAAREQRTLFAAWHSRYAPAIASTRSILSTRRIERVTVTWKEDVRVWHPGQEWIWRAGGLGVFDPGINALSILTDIIPGPVALRDAELWFPSNCETPIAARLALIDCHGALVETEFDFRQQGKQSWDITVHTNEGLLTLSMGGEHLSLDGVPMRVSGLAEYRAIYARFAELIRLRQCDVDLAPLQLVADAFLCGRRVEVEPFSA